MSTITLIKFLFGSRKAITQIANSRSALLIGFLFVLSAGFAREYDGEDLLHEPFYLLIPFIAAFCSAALLFSLVHCVFYKEEYKGQEFHFLFSFLSLFWMTAPLAWLYAIPFERFLDPYGATKANLTLLGIVACWRVLLIARVVSVLYRKSFNATIFVVMLFADSAALVAMYFTPTPIISLMGGIRLTETEALIVDVKAGVVLVGVISWLLWLTGTCHVAYYKKSYNTENSTEPTPGRKISLDLWALAVVSIAGWFFILPYTQPPQQRRRHVEKLFRDKRVGEAIRYMSKFTAGDFPPLWDPPPRIGYGQFEPPVWKVLLLTAEDDISPWVRDIYFHKLVFRTNSSPFRSNSYRLDEMSDQDLADYVRLLQNHSDGAVIAMRHENELKQLSFDEEDSPDSEPKLTKERIQTLKLLKQLMEQGLEQRGS